MINAVGKGKYDVPSNQTADKAVRRRSTVGRQGWLGYGCNFHSTCVSSVWENKFLKRDEYINFL